MEVCGAPISVVVQLCLAVRRLARDHRDAVGNLDALLSEVETTRLILVDHGGFVNTPSVQDTVNKMRDKMVEVKLFVEMVVAQPKVVQFLKSTVNNKRLLEYKNEVFQRHQALTTAMVVAIGTSQQSISATSQNILESSAPRIRPGRTVANVGVNLDAVDAYLPQWDIEWVKHMTSNFSKDKRIGKGGSCSIYLATVGGRRYAVKVARRDDELRLSSGKFLLEREAEIMDRLRHRFVGTMVATSVGPSSLGDVICIVMDYWPGGSLTRRLGVVLEPEQRTPATSDGLLRWQARMRVLWQLATTLEYLHTCKPNPILHHDLKPDNVMLDSMCENPAIRLIDFGGSKVEIGDMRKKKTTVSASVDARWLAMATGTRDADPRALTGNASRWTAGQDVHGRVRGPRVRQSPEQGVVRQGARHVLVRDGHPADADGPRDPRERGPARRGVGGPARPEDGMALVGGARPA